MSADALLSRLEGVRCTGSGRWIARCPAHDDRHASLSIRELDDGRVLVHDFAGCSVEEVLSAAAVTFAMLYPERPVGDQIRRERRPFNAYDVLACVGFEALVASVAAASLARGDALSDVDRERLSIAASRLGRAAEVARGA